MCCNNFLKPCFRKLLQGFIKLKQGFVTLKQGFNLVRLNSVKIKQENNTPKWRFYLDKTSPCHSEKKTYLCHSKQCQYKAGYE